MRYDLTYGGGGPKNAELLETGSTVVVTGGWGVGEMGDASRRMSTSVVRSVSSGDLMYSTEITVNNLDYIQSGQK